MGGCVTKSSFTVNKPQDIRLARLHPFLFSKSDAEQVLLSSDEGDYLLYIDHDSERIMLSVRMNSYIRHYRITELNGLYYLEGQPYAYLDSIILYHRKVKLNGGKLNKQAHLSARVVQNFAHRVARSNGNMQRFTNKNSPDFESPLSTGGLLVPSATRPSRKHSRTNSYTSLLTTSSDSTCKQQRL
ncbi:CAunnamed protein product [Biomphalaria glabrata]|uniref:SH2 domain-containing protein n=1 Tax=Biomphalaria glabrata TaxID=6526 RepID=A0A2C9LBN7_BIOGL|nr:CAunnamed protein product [Biomphalaria glabrata]